MMQIKTKNFQENIKKFGKALKKKFKQLMVAKKLNMKKITWKWRLNLINDLPLNKPIKLRLLTIIIRCVISKNGKFYPQLFLDDALCEL